jgi:hypothetical protein
MATIGLAADPAIIGVVEIKDESLGAKVLGIRLSKIFKICQFSNLALN